MVYFVGIRHILLLLGIFIPFWYVVTRKIWQHCSNHPTGENLANVVTLSSANFDRATRRNDHFLKLIIFNVLAL
jgi:hypothetical protein